MRKGAAIPAKLASAAVPSFVCAPFGIRRSTCACGGTLGPTGNCEACRKKRLQHKTRNTELGTRKDSSAPPIVHEVLRSPGQPLDAGTRAFMEPRFRHDFRRVRVHADSRAALSARAVQADAYTVGKDVVFGAGMYAPQSSEGQRLLAHELTHVIQQRNTATYPASNAHSRIELGGARNELEREADSAAESIESISPCFASRLSPAPASLQRKCTPTGWEFEYDGCSVPPALASAAGIDKDNPAGGKDTQFSNSVSGSPGTLACDKHDECYQTCNPSPGARAKCDEAMHQYMKLICVRSSENVYTKAQCFKWAEIYYTALRAGGGSAFAARQTETCSCKSPPKPTPMPSSTLTPTPTPTSKFPRSGPAKTTGSLLRIRIGPGLHFIAVGELGDRGTPIQVITQVHGEPVEDNDLWDQIDRGFVSDRFVAFDASP